MYGMALCRRINSAKPSNGHKFAVETLFIASPVNGHAFCWADAMNRTSTGLAVRIGYGRFVKGGSSAVQVYVLK